MSSLLTVPMHRIDKIQAALASKAWGLILDLEDSVPDASKKEALDNLLQHFDASALISHHVSVRVNSVTEIETFCNNPVIDSVILPKLRNATALQEVYELICDNNSHLSVELLIETAESVHHIDMFASVGMVSALHFGGGDYGADMKSPSLLYDHPHAFNYAKQRVLTAARAYGLKAYDTPCNAISSEHKEFFLQCVHASESLGFDGKWCLNKQQVGVVNEFFKLSNDVAPIQIGLAEKQLIVHNGLMLGPPTKRMVSAYASA